MANGEIDANWREIFSYNDNDASSKAGEIAGYLMVLGFEAFLKKSEGLRASFLGEAGAGCLSIDYAALDAVRNLGRLESILDEDLEMCFPDSLDAEDRDSLNTLMASLRTMIAKIEKRLSDG